MDTKSYTPYPIKFYLRISPTQSSVLYENSAGIYALGFDILDDDQHCSIGDKNGSLFIKADPLVLDKAEIKIKELFDIIDASVVDKVDINFSQLLTLSNEEYLNILRFLEDEITELGIKTFSVTGREEHFPGEPIVLDYDLSETENLDKAPEPTAKAKVPLEDQGPDPLIILPEVDENSIAEISVTDEDAGYKIEAMFCRERGDYVGITTEDVLEGASLIIRLQKAIRNAEAKKSLAQGVW